MKRKMRKKIETPEDKLVLENKRFHMPAQGKVKSRIVVAKNIKEAQKKYKNGEKPQSPNDK